MKKKEVMFCEWCNNKPYYISIHNDNKTPKETLLCKDCYEDWESGKIDNNYDTMRDEQIEAEYEKSNTSSALNE